MKVILLAAASLNGKITSGTDPNIYSWTSLEDQKIFFEKIKKAKLIIMGAKTYEHAKHLMKHKKGRIRVVLTRTPKKYRAEKVAGMLEFTDNTPCVILKRFENKEIKEALLVGGSEINSLFFEQNLIDEIHLTIEPLVFGSGKNLFEKTDYHAKLQLVSSQKLNNQGTLRLIYKVNTS